MPESLNPLSNVVEFTRKKREPSLTVEPRRYGACRHIRVYVNEEKRLITCQACKTILDPFQVLLEMANQERRWLNDLEAWEAMRDSRLSDRYDAEWQRHVDDIIEPPANPELREIWEKFHAYFGNTFCAMYKRKARKKNGPYWYGRNTTGCTVSLEYVRSQLLPKLQTSRPRPE